MEPRVAKLEESAQDARERLARLESKLDHVATDVSQFKWWAAGSAVAIILTMTAAVIGTGVGVQQMTVATFQAAAQVAASAPAPVPAPHSPVIINMPGAVAAQPAASAASR